MRRFLTVLAIVMTAGAANAAAPEVRTLGEAEPGAAVIEDVAFLAGRWVGEGFGGHVEEQFLPPMSGQMPGVFRHLKDGAPVFYEFMMIEEAEGTLLFHVKHFNPDMTGWEEKDESTTFRLVGVEGQTAWFSGLTLQRDGDALTIAISLSQGGERTTHLLEYELAE